MDFIISTIDFSCINCYQGCSKLSRCDGVCGAGRLFCKPLVCRASLCGLANVPDCEGLIALDSDKSSLNWSGKGLKCGGTPLMVVGGYLIICGTRLSQCAIRCLLCGLGLF